MIVLDAIELDIHRLNTLIPHWPTFFTHLNAARNFVRRFCSARRFRYTGHPDVEASRFALYVHFNAAKKAWKEGKFVLGEGPDSEALREVGGKRAALMGGLSVEGMRKETGEGWYNVSTAAYGTRIGKGWLKNGIGGTGNSAEDFDVSTLAPDAVGDEATTPSTTFSNSSQTNPPVNSVDDFAPTRENGNLFSVVEEMEAAPDADDVALEREFEDKDDHDPFKVTSLNAIYS
jgi:hypothetical protein